MATKKKRVQGYVDDNIDAKLKEFCQDNGNISESKAVIIILERFFFGGDFPTGTSKEDVETMKEKIASEVKSDLEQQFKADLEAKVKELTSHLERNQKIIFDRLEALEGSESSNESLSESSNESLSESPSESKHKGFCDYQNEMVTDTLIAAAKSESNHELKEGKDYTQVELVNMFGVPKSTISRLTSKAENGENRKQQIVLGNVHAFWITRAKGKPVYTYEGTFKQQVA